MQKLRIIWRRVLGVLIAAFIFAHTLAIIGGAINRLAAGAEYNAFDHFAGNLLTATGTIQRWNMFSPNVGDWTYAPVLRLTFKDGTQELIHSPATPELVDLPIERFHAHDATADELAMRWKFHIWDGRRSKLDSRVTQPVAGTWQQATTYARWQLVKYIRENPERAKDIAKVDLLDIQVYFAGEKPLPRRADWFYEHIYPQTDPQWPAGIEPTFKLPVPKETAGVPGAAKP